MEALYGKFESELQYFSRAVELLCRYSWIYRVPNTHILVDGVLRHVPREWVDVLRFDRPQDVRRAIAGEPLASWPDDLQHFVTSCRNLSLRLEGDLRAAKGDQKKWRKTNPKKVHEIVHFSELIGRHCQRRGIRQVVDIGSGLGYIDNELSERFELDALGLERDAYRVSVATQRAASNNRVSFKELCVSDDDTLANRVETAVGDWLTEIGVDNTAPLAMIGLHSCGDLSPAMMKLFLDSPRFRSLMLISCCYHRMECADHFPLSDALKSAASDGPFHQLDGLHSFMRLAVQETPNHWAASTGTSDRQVLHNFYRAILQLYAVQENVPLLKQQRKAVKDRFKKFSDYVEDAVLGFGLNGDDHRTKLLDLHRQHEHLLPPFETLIVLQALVQPVGEALVLLDRVAHLRQSPSVTSSLLKKVFDDCVSPRCFVTIADK